MYAYMNTLCLSLAQISRFEKIMYKALGFL